MKYRFTGKLISCRIQQSFAVIFVHFYKSDKNVLKHKIFSDFKISDRFSKSKIKEKLSMIYNQLGYKKTPKANDLEEWFDIKDILMTENNKRVHGFEIIKRKDEQ